MATLGLNTITHLSATCPKRQDVEAVRASPLCTSWVPTRRSLSLSTRPSSPNAVAAARRQALGVAMKAAESATNVTADSEAPPAKLLDVLIESEAGVSYDTLQQRLARGEWEAADNETRRLLYVLAGEGSAKRKWVYFTEVQFIPSKDLLTLDRLWRKYSNDRFGYTVQRRMWKALDRQWKPFFLKIDWAYGENSTFRKFPMEFKWESEAAVGHLPLTNCLRGTQLYEKLLTHPAFDSFDAEQMMPDDTKLPDIVKNSETSSSEFGAVIPPPSSIPKGLTGSIFDEDFDSSDYGF